MNANAWSCSNRLAFLMRFHGELRRGDSGCSRLKKKRSAKGCCNGYSHSPLKFLIYLLIKKGKKGEGKRYQRSWWLNYICVRVCTIQQLLASWLAVAFDSSTGIHNIDYPLCIKKIFFGCVHDHRRLAILGTREEQPSTMKMSAAVLAVAVFASGFALVSGQGEKIELVRWEIQSVHYISFNYQRIRKHGNSYAQCSNVSLTWKLIKNMR